MSASLQGEYRGSVSKGGPRVLTFVPAGSASYPLTLTNCPKCSTYSAAEVLGEDYSGGSDPGEGGQPLVHGWYQIDTEVDIFWQQLNPANACDAAPYYHGLALKAGGCAVFFVDHAKRDGIIAVTICASASLGACVSGYVRVNRRDTTRTMAQTGERAQLEPAPESNACRNTSIVGTDP